MLQMMKLKDVTRSHVNKFIPTWEQLMFFLSLGDIFKCIWRAKVQWSVPYHPITWNFLTWYNSCTEVNYFYGSKFSFASEKWKKKKKTGKSKSVIRTSGHFLRPMVWWIHILQIGFFECLKKFSETPFIIFGLNITINVNLWVLFQRGEVSMFPGSPRAPKKKDKTFLGVGISKHNCMFIATLCIF